MTQKVKMKDNIYRKKLDKVRDFQFDEKTVSVFPDMIERSVPGYKTLVSLIGTISAKFAKPDTAIYDLGCSLGATSFSILENLSDFKGDIIAVDKSEAMISKLKHNITQIDNQLNIIPLVADVRDIEIKNASFVAMNLTIQFIDPKYRDGVIQNIYEGLNVGGAFILSEKIKFENEDHENTMHDLFYNFKKCRGYSNIEIDQKKKALKNVLIPETFEQHKLRLEKAGFKQIYQWFQGFNFISMIGIK